jgi:hypothetical protein
MSDVSTELVEKTLLERYIEEVKVDTKLDEFTIKDVQMRLPGLKHKWVGQLIRSKVTLNRLQKEKEKLKKEIVEKLKTESPVKMSDVAFERTAEGHERMKGLTSSIEELKIVIEYLEKVEKIFHSFTFDLRNAIQIMQMETL